MYQMLLQEIQYSDINYQQYYGKITTETNACARSYKYFPRDIVFFHLVDIDINFINLIAS